MCRIFTYHGELGSEDFIVALKKFSHLAKDVCVPCGIEAGHADGWGITAATKNDEVYFRSIEEISEKHIAGSVVSIPAEQGNAIAHLRKATSGKIALCNTHPFAQAGIHFCHNGSIHAFPKTAFVSDRYLREGHTDSETFFLRILDRISGQIGDASLGDITIALKKEIFEIQKTTEWTSLICLLQSRKGIIVNYLWNENHSEAVVRDFEKYYTLYRGRKGDNTIICSEMLEIPGFIWEKLDNGSIFEIPIAFL
jgi:predicted glutamine amidotransferase